MNWEKIQNTKKGNQFDKFQMQKQPTVSVILVEAGFTAAVGEQTNLHLPTNGRAEAIMDTIYENRFAIQNPV